jgi:hypothetical protein
MNVRLAASTLVLGTTLAAASLGMTGCVAGNSTRIQSPTVGRQLIDLQEAYEKGAITEAEYEKQKARFLAEPQITSTVTIRRKEADSTTEE